MLSFLFKPKWQHARPAVRLAALAKLDNHNSDNLAIIRQLACHDDDSAVRQAALDKLENSSELFQLLISCPQSDELVARLKSHQQLSQHLNQLPVEIQCRLLQEQTAEKLPVLLGQLTEQNLLEIAQQANQSSLRLGAAEQVIEPENLKQLAKSLRQRDKSVYRLVRDKLAALEALEQQQQAQQQLCSELLEQLETLANSRWQPLFDAKLELLEQQWQAFTDSQDNPAAQAAIAKAREVVEAQRQQQAVQQQQQYNIEQKQLWQADIEQWQQLLLGTTLDQATISELLSQWQTLEQRYLELTEQPSQAYQQASQLQQALQRLGEFLQLEQPLSQQHLDTLDWPAHLPTPAAVKQLRKQLGEQQRQQQQAELINQQSLEQQQQQLEHLALLIDEGQTREARDLLAKLQVQPALQARLQQLKGALAKLQQWQHAAAQEKKQQLCQQAEQLLASSLAAAELAPELKALQQQWRQLDRTDSRHQQQDWQRFKSACDALYQRCQTHIDEQQKQRELNLEKRRAMCEQLAEFLAGPAELADWQAICTLNQTARVEWRGYSPVEHRQGRPLQRKFNAQLKQLDALQAERREQIYTTKQALLEQLEQLLDSPADNTGAAIKGLQQQWRELSVTYDRRDRRQWQIFRQRCELYFSQQQQAAKGSASAKRRANQLCEQLESALSPLQPLPLVRSWLAKAPELLEQLAEQPGTQRAIRQRLETAQEPIINAIEKLEKLNPTKTETIELNQQQLQELLLQRCIELEIRLDIPSPVQDQQQRLALQMQRLEQLGQQSATTLSWQSLAQDIAAWRQLAEGVAAQELQLRVEKIAQQWLGDN